MIRKKQKREDVQESETPDSKKAKIKTKTPHTVPKVKRVSEGRLLTGRRGVFAYWTNSVFFFLWDFFFWVEPTEIIYIFVPSSSTWILSGEA